MPRPPLYGFALGRNLGLEQERQRIGALHAALNMHGALQQQELTPLKRQALEQKLQEGALMNAILKQHGGMGGASGPAGPSVSPEAALAQGAAVGDVGPTMTNAARMTQGAPMPMSGGTGLEPPPNVQAMLMHPLLRDRGKVLAEAYKPTPEMRALVARGVVPGSQQWNAELGTRFTPQGAFNFDAQGNIVTDPRFVSSIGEIEGAKEREKARYDLITRPSLGPNQQPTYTSRLDMLNAGTPAGGATAPMPGPQPHQGRPPDFPRVSPEVQAQRDAEANRLKVAEGQPGGGGLIPSSTVLSPPNAAGMSPEATAQQQSRAAAGTEVAKGDAQLVLGYRQKIPNVTSTLRRLDRLEALNTDDTTFAAAGAEFKTTLGSIGQALGINVGNIKTANSEMYLAQIGELMKDRLGSKDYGSGSGVSNIDLLAARQPLPELARTQQGRALIIQAIRDDTNASLADMNAARTHFDRTLSLSGFQFPSEVSAQVRNTRPGQPAQAAPRPGGKVVKWSDL